MPADSDRASVPGANRAGEPAALPGSTPAGPGRLTTWHGDLLAALGRLGWLGGLSDRVAAALIPVRERYQGNPVLELSNGGRWAGHPLHPALSDLPVGLWSGAVLLDVTGHDPRSGRRLGPAGVLSAAGLVAGVAAFFTGVSDWAVSNEPDRRVGLFHGLLNSLALGLQAASLGSRAGGHRGTARVLGAASLSVTAAASYLGGHLVFARGVMVSRVAWADGPRRWSRALPDADLPSERPAAVEVEGRRVVLYRDRDGLHALDNVCSHAGGLLSRGTIADGALACPLHGSRFAIADGRVLRGPASQPQPVLPTRVRSGWIEVRGAQPPARLRQARNQRA